MRNGALCRVEKWNMLTGIVEIPQDVYLSALQFNIRTGGNLMVFGQAGIGKTEMAQQAARMPGSRCTT